MENSVLKIWQTDSSVKVIKNKEYEKNPAFKLSVKLFGNETESARFYITPEKNVSSLKVSLSRAITGVSLSVGYVLYVNLTKSSAGTKSETGYYPDAIIPFDVASKHGLNRIKAGENQELYITVKADENIKGNFSNELIIDADGYKTVIPVEITVWDYSLPVKNHTRQYFIIDYNHLNFVEGGGFDTYKRYYEDLLKYRVNGSRMPFALDKDYRTVSQSYIDNLRIYYSDKRITVFNLPVFFTKENDDVEYEKTEYLFNEVVKASIKDGVDYFEKALTYLWILDEPHLTPKKIGYCKNVLPQFEKLKNKIALECENNANKNPLYFTLAKSIRKLPNVLTSGVNGKILPEGKEDYYVTWCPAFDNLSQHEFYKMTNRLNQGEKWWYGCNWPVPPFPTYHIDDSYLSPRVLSWIQFAFNVTGNLYWRVNYWAKKDGDKLVYIDPYEGSTYPTTNGEGMLVYPGGKFGLDSFVPSVRLKAIRDGIEDYETLYCLQKAFVENAKKIDIDSLSVNEVLQPLYSRLFNKTMILEKVGEYFDRARETVANMLLAAKKYSFTVSALNKKERTINFYAENCNIIVDGSVEKNGNLYKITSNKDCVNLILQGEKGEFSFDVWFEEIPHAKKFALSDCWAKTVKTYGVCDCEPENILKPYYEILDGTGEYNGCCKALSGLIGFVWKTEAAITKKQKGKLYEITVVIPYGELSTQEQFTSCSIDENAKRYIISTDKKSICLEVENKNGKYTAELFVY